MSLLVLDGVTKRYSDARRSTLALDEISIAVESGELVAVWGGRGSGRTTLLRIAAGLEQPDAGVVRFGGIDLSDGAQSATAAGLAYVQPRLLGPQRYAILRESGTERPPPFGRRAVDGEARIGRGIASAPEQQQRRPACAKPRDHGPAVDHRLCLAPESRNGC